MITEVCSTVWEKKKQWAGSTWQSLTCRGGRDGATSRLVRGVGGEAPGGARRGAWLPSLRGLPGAEGAEAPNVQKLQGAEWKASYIRKAFPVCPWMDVLGNAVMKWPRTWVDKDVLSAGYYVTLTVMGESAGMSSKERQLIQPRGSKERKWFGHVWSQQARSLWENRIPAGVDLGEAGGGPAQKCWNLGEGRGSMWHSITRLYNAFVQIRKRCPNCTDATLH